MPTLIDDPHYQILRGNFTAEGVERERGEIVDTTDWRFSAVKSLVSARYLGNVPIKLEDAARCPCDRLWIDETSEQAHQCPARARRKRATKET